MGDNITECPECEGQGDIEIEDDRWEDCLLCDGQGYWTNDSPKLNTAIAAEEESK